MIMKNIEDVRRVVDAEKPLAVRRMFAESYLQDQALRDEYFSTLDDGSFTEEGYVAWLRGLGTLNEDWELPVIKAADVDMLLAELDGAKPRVVDGSKIGLGTADRFMQASTLDELRDALAVIIFGRDVAE